MDHSTTVDREILGDTLNHAIDAYFDNQTPDTMRTLFARLIERCSSAGTSYGVLLYERDAQHDARLTKLEAQG